MSVRWGHAICQMGSFSGSMEEQLCGVPPVDNLISFWNVESTLVLIVYCPKMFSQLLLPACHRTSKSTRTWRLTGVFQLSNFSPVYPPVGPATRSCSLMGVTQKSCTVFSSLVFSLEVSGTESCLNTEFTIFPEFAHFWTEQLAISHFAWLYIISPVTAVSGLSHLQCCNIPAKLEKLLNGNIIGIDSKLFIHGKWKQWQVQEESPYSFLKVFQDGELGSDLMRSWKLPTGAYKTGKSKHIEHISVLQSIVYCEASWLLRVQVCLQSTCLWPLLQLHKE